MHQSEKSIFLHALEQSDRVQRDAYLDEACGGDDALRASVEGLLAASDLPDNLLDQPPMPLPIVNSDASSAAQLIGQLVGPYRLMEQIGEGGFGLVFVAQQEKPVRRSVALKIVKPGMGSQEVIARFEAERQAVALMDHPNIARVFDAGVTSDGRPYFVMELVRGTPIVEFADGLRMTLAQRLALFMDVCSAVHHAHQKGIIHRDIKPSNVMVTLHDDKPVVKVIDFGVAKAIGQSLTDKTIYTRFYSMIGTPLYMSPEQAEMNGLDVDTRSDIYSLGVLLYELLSGAPPFDRDRLDSAGLDEMRRIIREEEPPRPSKRLSTLGGVLTTVSASRRLEPSRLPTLLRGDLDWIVMKAIEKDRNRRYDSAAAMGSDILRFLEEQPIEARPPSLTYRLQKFGRRNRGALSTAAILLLSIVLGLAASLWQMRLAMNERDQKEEALAKVERFLGNVTRANALVASAETFADSQQWRLAKVDFDAAVQQQPNYYLPWISRAQFYARLNLWHHAADDFAQAIQLGAPTHTPQWWGAPALLAWTGHEVALSQLSDEFARRLTSQQKIEGWEDLRFGLVNRGHLSGESYEALAQIAESWLHNTHAQGLRELRPGFRSQKGRSPLPFDADGRRSGRKGPRRSPGLGFLPRPTCEYITGVAHLRAGNYEQAIERLQHSGRGDWPGAGLTKAPLAMAYAALDRNDEALQCLEESDRAIVRMADAVLYSEGPQRRLPWFDLIELLQFNREATWELTGKSPQVVEQLEQIRQRARQLIQE